MNKNSKIYIAGHRGLVGSAVIKYLINKKYENLIFRTHHELDLTNQKMVNEFFEQEKPDYVFLAAAKVGGINANNNYPAEFIYSNLMVEANVIHAAYNAGVKDLLFLGSSCIYPRLAKQPMNESALNTGLLEPTNEPYAIAKIAGIKLCESYNRQYGTTYRSVMPTNLYGENDNFDLDKSHVIPALIRKFHEAKVNGKDTVTVWGTGNVKREFLHVDDMVAAAVYVLTLDKATYEINTKPMLSHVNIGTGIDVTIRELAETISEVVGFNGAIHFDSSKPDGAPRKLLDVSLINKLGWRASVGLREGLASTYSWYLNANDIRR
jgi:GDP-L-fucose synthase